MKNFFPEDYIRAVVHTDDELKYLVSCLEFCWECPDLQPCIDLIALLDDTLHALFHELPAPEPISFPISKVSVDLPIIDRCNLACECCSHYAPLAKDASPVDLTDLSASLDLFREKCQSAVNQVNILGGEPLLHDDLPAIVQLVHDNFPFARRFVVSNMLMFERRKTELGPIMKNTDTWFGYSGYQCNETSIQFATKNNDGIAMVRFGETPMRFHKVLKSETPRFSTVGKKICAESSCLTLIGNRVYLCSATPYLKYLNSAFGSTLHPAPFDYIELSNIERAAEILLFAALPNPFCRHCDMKNARCITPGRSSKSKAEWLLD